MLELALPGVIMLLIGVIKNGITVDTFEEAIPTSDTPVMTYDAYQNTTTFPNVLCYDNNIFMRYVIMTRLPDTPVLFTR